MTEIYPDGTYARWQFVEYELSAAQREAIKEWDAGARAMREACAKWHDDEAERIRNLPPRDWHDGSETKKINAIGDHEDCAISLRALHLPARPK